jgi:hypothetical protein
MAALASLLVLGLPTAPQNLLRNGDFEAGTLSGWDIDCSTESCTSPSVSSDSHSGRGAALLSSTSDRWTVVALRQDASPAPRCTLRLNVWTRADSSSEDAPAAELQLAIGFVDAAGEPLRDDAPCRLERHWPGREWAQVGVACDAPAAAEGVRVWVQLLSVRSDAAALIDGISLSCQTNEFTAGLATANPTAAGGMRSQVPPLVHFIFGLAPDFGGKPFGLVHHLVVKAAVHFARAPGNGGGLGGDIGGLSSVTRRLGGDATSGGSGGQGGGLGGNDGPGSGHAPTVYFYHAHVPSGEWWDRTVPLLQLRRVRAPSTVFGRPLRRFAHQADVVRLEVLLSFGGVYLDLDVMLLAPLAPLMGPAPILPSHTRSDASTARGDDSGLLSLGGGSAVGRSTAGPMGGGNAVGRSIAGPGIDNAIGGVVLAEEGVDGSIGLGNAFMLTSRNHSFFRAWYNEYRNFSGARALLLPPTPAPFLAACNHSFFQAWYDEY